MSPPSNQLTSDSPNDSSYVNINRYRSPSKLSHEDNNYVNINAKVSTKTDAVNPRNSTHLPPKINIFDNDDDSDYSCEEIGNPQKNYHILDFRKTAIKKLDNYLTSSANIPRPSNENEEFTTITNPWRKRSSTENCGHYRPKFDDIIYAELNITDNHPSNKHENCHHHLDKKDHIKIDRVDYAQIDLNKTQALKDIDNELEKLTNCRVSKHPCRLKMKSVNTICHRLIDSVKNVKKGQKKKKN